MRHASLYAAKLPIGGGATEGTRWKIQTARCRSRRASPPRRRWCSAAPIYSCASTVFFPVAAACTGHALAGGTLRTIAYVSSSIEEEERTIGPART
jgi:hypothetical protein